ncbi:MAG: Rab family GTPase [Candidatus Hodarchaeota archaeon]
MRDEWVLKICAAGSYQVGKTSLIRRYAEDKFEESYTPTIGVDVTVKRVTIENQEIKLLLWDTAGQEVFGRIRPMYFEGAFGCIIVYDITRTDTFKDLDRWITEFRTPERENAPIAIIGNKIDLEDTRNVSTEEGKEFAESYSVPFYECSAKLGGEEIENIYTDLVRRYLEDIEKT